MAYFLHPLLDFLFPLPAPPRNRLCRALLPTFARVFIPAAQLSLLFLALASTSRLAKPWDEKDAAAVEEEFSLEDLFGDDLPGSKEEL